jgi:hypothetical protein
LILTFPLHWSRTWQDTSGAIIKSRNKRWNMQKNPGGPFDVAVLHHYGPKSEEEHIFKKCIRLDVNNHALSCDKKLAVPQGPIIRDDSAWQILWLTVPSHQQYDHVTDMG